MADLIHRRPAAATTSIPRTPDINGKTRRKKRSGIDRSTLNAIGVLVSMGCLILAIARIRNENADDRMQRRTLLAVDWKPKPRLRVTEEKVDAIMHNNDEKATASKRVVKHATKSQGNAEPLIDPKDSKSLYRYKFSTADLGYDIYNCPPTPPKDYPRAWSITDIIGNWNPNDVTTIPPSYREVYHSLCIFDFQTQYEDALTYRDAEKPFIIRNDPRVMAASKKWTTPNYLMDNLPNKKVYTERSPVNHFMFYNARQRKNVRNWVQPLNDVVSMTYAEWLERALERDAHALEDDELKKRVEKMRSERRERELTREEPFEVAGGDDEVKEDLDHEDQKRLNWYYWRLNAFVEDAEKDDVPSKLAFNDMPFFDPRKPEESKFYLVDPTDQRGINCRFGMRGVIAESHCDLSRNMIALLEGERRYIIGHPNQCPNLYLYPRGHPSGRHASFDWSNPSNWDTHPQFRNALQSEVIMKAGDVLYLPTAWFHHVINLSTNIQCNIRSGISYENSQVLKDCGFKLPKQ